MSADQRTDREILLALEAKVDSIHEIHSKILAVVEEVKPQVLSLIDRLEKNPMAKMILGGK